MIKPDNCPHCKVSLIGGEIPDNINQPIQFSDGTWHKPYGDATHWRREIGIEILGGYDGVLFYQCPDCDGLWNRWPVGHYLHAKAEAEMKKGPVHARKRR